MLLLIFMTAPFALSRLNKVFNEISANCFSSGLDSIP